MMTEIKKDNVFKTTQNWLSFSFFKNKEIFPKVNSVVEQELLRWCMVFEEIGVC